MTQEEKQLLLVDLSARLPYGVKMNHIAEMGIAPETLIGIAKDMITLQNSAGYCTDDIDLYKPYLFPLSSMTEEQKKEFDISMDMEYAIARNAEVICANRMIDFFNKNHFDYRGLILMGLANDATGLNIY